MVAIAMPYPHSLSQLLALTLDELIALQGIDLKDPVLSQYSKVIRAYLESDLTGLQNCLMVASDVRVRACCQIRLQIRTRSFDQKFLTDFLRQCEGERVWEAESHFLYAMAFETQDQPKVSAEHYFLAYGLFLEVDCERKALRSLFNALVAESRIDPSRMLIHDYMHLAVRARKLGELGLSGVAYLNISREYQKLGARELALKYAREALECSQAEIGSLHYYLIVVHLCHLYLELDRKTEATLEFQRARISKFPEIQEALNVLENRFATCDRLKPELTPQNLTPTWRERIDSSPLDPLSDKEQEVLEIIATRPRSKFDLIERVYGVHLPFEVTENRIKVLLNRLRKKRPGLVVRDKDKYRLSDDSVLRERSWQGVS